MQAINRNDLPVPGAPMEGGFFAGLITINGEQFGVVVAPRAQGETTGVWGQHGLKIDARHCGDGLANTQAMATAGSEIAAHVLALELNGHADWYIPSRDELELIYRNLKPTPRENICSFRDGENISSHPIGQPYTPKDPMQTPAALFREDGSEAMQDTWYWSSTQYSAYSAFFQDFAGGDQDGYDKDHRGRVRAVRRFKVID